MAWYPGAIRKEISKHRKPMAQTNRAFLLHVAVSEADSLYGYFSGSNVWVASHFYVRKSGAVEQYVDTRYQAPANYQANSTAYSVETQGGVRNPQGEPWTDAQVKALAQLSKWLNKTHGVPLTRMPNSRPSSRGIGYHRLGVNPWRVSGGELWSSAYGKICPGDKKISQIDDIIRLAGGVSLPTSSGNPGTSGTLRYGSAGSRVKAVQRLLNEVEKAGLTVDGKFGAATRRAVREFQAAQDLVIDGIVGPATLKRLKALTEDTTKPVNKPVRPSTPNVTRTSLRRGDRGAAVRSLQKTLNAKFPSYSRLVVDGIYGPATVAVVEQFQRSVRLTADGIYGPNTKEALAEAKGQSTSKPEPAKLKVDGKLGPATIKRWQKEMGTPADGVISRTSSLVRAVQKHLISEGFRVGRSGADGKLGPNTIKALQRYLKTPVDGVISNPSTMVKALQKRLNTGKF